MSRTCFVAAPFGKPKPASGMVVDFSAIYELAVRPAVEDAGLEPVRGEDMVGALTQKDALSALLGSEVMIADITGANPNVLYQLGIRHALRPGGTLLLCASTERIPFDIAYTRVLTYELDAGGLTQAGADVLRERLTVQIETSLQFTQVDSPLYQLFPDLRAELPAEVIQSARAQRGSMRGSARSDRVEYVVSKESWSGGTGARRMRGEPDWDLDPVSYLAKMKQHRDLSAWDDLIRLAQEAPPELARSPEVMQLLALALNRRGAPGDQDHAIALMTELVKKTGGDGETFGILGRIFKDRFDSSGDRGDLLRATDYYRKGFERDPADFYPGVDAVTLLLQQGGRAAGEELRTLLPRVRDAVDTRLYGGMAGYWEYATALHLACVAGDWAQAYLFARRAVDQVPAVWMLYATLHDLEALQRTAAKDDVARIEIMMDVLRDQAWNAEER